MGSSKSSSSSSQVTSTVDNRVVAAEGSITATGGSTIISTDKDVALAAIDASTVLGKAGLNTATDIVDKNAAITEASRVANNNLAQSLAETAISNVKQNADSQSVQIIDSLVEAGKYAAAAGAVVAIGYVILKKK